MTRRPEFLAAAKCPFAARGCVVVQRRDRADGSPIIRIGFTATRKVGNAVTRNRAKRRLREAARRLVPLHAGPGCDYVFVARTGAPDRAWPRLLDDMKSALLSLAPTESAERPTAGP